MRFSDAVRTILSEFEDTVLAVDAEEAAAFAKAVNGAARVFLAGQGRSGLVARSFAMRLAHMGLVAFVVGETTTPGVGRGDLLVVVSGSGETPTNLHLAEGARQAGAKVAAVTADGGSSLAAAADTVLVVAGKVKTGKGRDSAQMPGSLFEQAAFVTLEATVMMLATLRGESHDSMRRRHTNLE